MAVVGFNFHKILVEKAEAVKSGKINISNNVSITGIEEKDVSFGSSAQKSLRISFEFTSTYEPKMGSIQLCGSTLYMSDQKKSKEVLDAWKKDKKVAKDVMTEVLNTVLTKCNIQALLLSQEVNLPPPIPLPKVRPDIPKTQ